MSLALAALLAMAAVRGSVEASARVDVRARNGAALAGPAIDVEASPELRAVLGARRWELAAEYSPRFSHSLFGSDPQSFVFQQARLAASAHDRRGSLSFTQEASYGSSSLTALITDPSAAGAPLPLTTSASTIDTIAYVASRTGLLGRYAPARRWGLTLSLEYSLSGGADARSRAAFPLQSGQRGGVGVEHAASRRDQLTFAVDAERALLSTGWDDTLARSTLSWRRAWGRSTVSTVMGGVGWATSRAEGSGERSASAHAVASATIAARPRAAMVELGLTLRLSPVIDRLSGRIDERVEGFASVAWRPIRALNLEGQLGAARSIVWDDPSSVALVYQALIVKLRANDIVQLEGGLRSAWTRTRGADAPPLQWLTFVGVTFTAPTLRF